MEQISYPQKNGKELLPNHLEHYHYVWIEGDEERVEEKKSRLQNKLKINIFYEPFALFSMFSDRKIGKSE